MKKFIKTIRQNYAIYLSFLIILVAIILSYKFLYWLYYEYTNQFGEGKNIFISGDAFASAQTLRELNLIHLFWAFIKVFITWAIALALISVLKIPRNNNIAVTKP